MKALNDAASFLRQGDNYVILSHRRPDGDTVGSAAALCRGLRAVGKQAWVLENPELTPRCAPFWEGLTRPDVPEDAALIAVDVSAPDMVLRGAEALMGRVDLCLDHHASNPGYAARNVIRADYAAAGELVYELLLVLEIPLDPAMGEALYLAVSTDTGGFRYSNLTAHTFRVAADSWYCTACDICCGIVDYQWGTWLCEDLQSCIFVIFYLTVHLLPS